MDFNEALEELNSYKQLKYNCAMLQTRIEVLKESDGYRSPQFGEPGGESSNGHGATWNLAMKILELEEELKATKQLMETKASEIALNIVKLEMPYNQLLDLLFLKNWNNIRIQIKMNYGRTSYFRIRNIAIEKYAALHNKNDSIEKKFKKI